MGRHACPVCGDPDAYPLWIDDEPPAGCPDDLDTDTGTWRGRIRTVTDCGRQMRRARQRAEWRKAAPDCFDDNGNMLPDRLAEVITRWDASLPADAKREVY